MADTPEQRGQSGREQRGERAAKRTAAGDNGQDDVLRLIIEEIDGARDVLQLVRQLEPALPIRSFKDLRQAANDQGQIRFRDVQIDLDFFEGMMPEYVFPIEDVRGLVARVAQLVRLIPPHMGRDPTSQENMRRMLKQLPALGPGLANTFTRGALKGVPAPSAAGGLMRPGVEKPG
jgi:hypothetical protein